MNYINKILLSVLCIAFCITSTTTVCAQNKDNAVLEKNGELKTVSDTIVSTTIALNDSESAIHIPFGIQKKKESVGPLSTIRPTEIWKYDNNLSFNSLINGRLAGMYGSTNIRGIGSALFIIDGAPGDPSYLNAQEIEEITLLKDAGSAVLYGVNAQNGVVMITTKRGIPHRKKFNVTFEQGYSIPVVLPKYLGSAEYMTLYNEARVNDGLSALYDGSTPETTIANYSGVNPYRYPDVDYYSSEYLKSSRPVTNLVTEFAGGNNSTQYYSSVSWASTGSLYTLGDAAKAKTNRFNIRSNVNTRVTDFIKTGIKVSVVFDNRKEPDGNFWSDVSIIRPNAFSPLLPIGLVASDATMLGDASVENARLIYGKYILGGTSIYTNNIYGNQAMGSYESTNRRLLQFSQNIDVDLGKLVEGLGFKTQVNMDVYNSHTQGVYNTYPIYQPTWRTYSEGIDSISGLTQVGTEVRTGVQRAGNEDFYRRLTATAMFDYNRTFAQDHSVSGTLLGYFGQYNRDNYYPDKDAHLGFRLIYDYSKQYYVDFSGAVPYGYKRAPGNRVGFSPSIGLGWVMSENDFMSEVQFIDFLKLKVSGAIVNYETNVNDYKMYLQTFGGSGGTFKWGDGQYSSTGRGLTHEDNRGINFEQMKNLNAGIEGILFDRSLSIDANLFYTRRSRQVTKKTTYPSYITGIPYENYNETSYSGADAGIEWRKSYGDFSLKLGINMLYTMSELTKYDEVYTYDYLKREGKSADAMYALECLGFFKDQNDISNSPLQKFGEVKPGDLKYKDQNNDGVIDSNDVVETGNSLAKISGGVSLVLAYGNSQLGQFSLFATGYGRQGASSYYSGEYFWVQGTDKYSIEVRNRWTPETAATATYPRLSSGDNSNNFRNSTFWLYKNDYFNVDRVQLNYDFPEHIAKTLFTNELSLYIRGNNLLRISQDSEKRQIRVASEPAYRDFAIGIKVMF